MARRLDRRFVSGAVEMAVEAGRVLSARGGQSAAHVAPVVWKLKFQKDASAGLAREMDYVEKRLQLEPGTASTPVSERLHRAYTALLTRDEAIWSGTATAGTYGERQKRIQAVMQARLRDALDRHGAPADPSSDLGQMVRRGERWLRTVDRRHGYRDEVHRLVRDLKRLTRFRPSLYPHPELTQEQIAECIKRLRNDYCEGTLRDTASRFVPRPVAPRTAHIRVPEPINVSAVMKGRTTLERAEVDAIVTDLRSRMQASVDALNAQIADLPPTRGGFVCEPNPFHEPGLIREG